MSNHPPATFASIANGGLFTTERGALDHNVAQLGPSAAHVVAAALALSGASYTATSPIPADRPCPPVGTGSCVLCPDGPGVVVSTECALHLQRTVELTSSRQHVTHPRTVLTGPAPGCCLAEAVASVNKSPSVSAQGVADIAFADPSSEVHPHCIGRAVWPAEAFPGAPANARSHAAAAAADDVVEALVVGCRGTANLTDWLTNFSAVHDADAPDVLQNVHGGFLERCRSIPLEPILAHVLGGGSVVFTGHSLGSSVAEVLCLSLLAHLIGSGNTAPIHEHRIIFVGFASPVLGTVDVGTWTRHKNVAHLFHHLQLGADPVPVVTHLARVQELSKLSQIIRVMIESLARKLGASDTVAVAAGFGVTALAKSVRPPRWVPTLGPFTKDFGCWYHVAPDSGKWIVARLVDDGNKVLPDDYMALDDAVLKGAVSISDHDLDALAKTLAPLIKAAQCEPPVQILAHGVVPFPRLFAVTDTTPLSAAASMAGVGCNTLRVTDHAQAGTVSFRSLYSGVTASATEPKAPRVLKVPAMEPDHTTLVRTLQYACILALAGRCADNQISTGYSARLQCQLNVLEQVCASHVATPLQTCSTMIRPDASRLPHAAADVPVTIYMYESCVHYVLARGPDNALICETTSPFVAASPRLFLCDAGNGLVHVAADHPGTATRLYLDIDFKFQDKVKHAFGLVACGAYFRLQHTAMNEVSCVWKFAVSKGCWEVVSFGSADAGKGCKLSIYVPGARHHAFPIPMNDSLTDAARRMTHSHATTGQALGFFAPHRNQSTAVNARSTVSESSAALQSDGVPPVIAWRKLVESWERLPPSSTPLTRYFFLAMPTLMHAALVSCYCGFDGIAALRRQHPKSPGTWMPFFGRATTTEVAPIIEQDDWAKIAILCALVKHRVTSELRVAVEKGERPMASHEELQAVLVEAADNAHDGFIADLAGTDGLGSEWWLRIENIVKVMPALVGAPEAERRSALRYLAVTLQVARLAATVRRASVCAVFGQRGAGKAAVMSTLLASNPQSVVHGGLNEPAVVAHTMSGPTGQLPTCTACGDEHLADHGHAANFIIDVPAVADDDFEHQGIRDVIMSLARVTVVTHSLGDSLDGGFDARGLRDVSPDACTLVVLTNPDEASASKIAAFDRDGVPIELAVPAHSPGQQAPDAASCEASASSGSSPDIQVTKIPKWVSRAHGAASCRPGAPCILAAPDQAVCNYCSESTHRMTERGGDTLFRATVSIRDAADAGHTASRQSQRMITAWSAVCNDAEQTVQRMKQDAPSTLSKLPRSAWQFFMRDDVQESGTDQTSRHVPSHVAFAARPSQLQGAAKDAVPPVPLPISARDPRRIDAAMLWADLERAALRRTLDGPSLRACIATVAGTDAVESWLVDALARPGAVAHPSEWPRATRTSHDDSDDRQCSASPASERTVQPSHLNVATSQSASPRAATTPTLPITGSPATDAAVLSPHSAEGGVTSGAPPPKFDPTLQHDCVSQWGDI